MLRHLDLFSGIGGFALAARWTGKVETIGFCEIDPWCRRVLAKHWPDVIQHDDIKTLAGSALERFGRIDLITGGYPCQPFSLAGQRRGADDPRHLWPHLRTVIDQARPRFVLLENVAGHISMGLDVVLADLEADGYTCGAVVVPAGAVNALHRRDRVWIMANAHAGQRDGAIREVRARRNAVDAGCADVADAQRWGQPRSRLRGDAGNQAAHREREAGNAVDAGPGAERPEAPRPLDAGADGLSTGLVRRPAAGPDAIRDRWADGSWEDGLPRVVTSEPDRKHKLMGAGNAIVPLVAYEILSVMIGEAA